MQAGDRLWFRANSSGVTNGTLASLAGTDEQGRLVTTDGFVVPEDYLKIAHGYATTSHSSQGLTANFAVVFGASFDQKAIYVSHSRARERVDTYVPSKEAFLTRAERAQGERLGVLEAIADARKNNGNAGQWWFKVGDKVNWSMSARGGYGYTQQIAGVVTKLGRSKIQIRVAKRDNGSWVAAERWVRQRSCLAAYRARLLRKPRSLSNPKRNLWIKSSYGRLAILNGIRCSVRTARNLQAPILNCSLRGTRSSQSRRRQMGLAREIVVHRPRRNQRNGLAKWLPENAAAAAPKPARVKNLRLSCASWAAT